MERSADGHGKIAIQARGVVKNFGAGDSRVQALKGVDLDVNFGEMMMGGGSVRVRKKTTFLSVLCGTLEFDAGAVNVFGQDLSAMKDREVTAFRGKNVGFIFQQFNLIPTWSAVENVSIPLLLRGVNRKDAEAEATRLLEAVGDRARNAMRIRCSFQAASNSASRSRGLSCMSRA